MFNPEKIDNLFLYEKLDIKSYSIATNSTVYQASAYVDSKGILTFPVSSQVPIPVINFNNINQFRNVNTTTNFFGSITYATYQPMTYLPIYENINHLLTPGITKYEYFYNKPTLSIKTLGADDIGTTLDGYYQSQIIIDNLKYYEVDMIPFFQYFIDDNIYQGVSVPWQGIAPFIDYTNSNFSFIDNINIGLGSVQTMQSYTPISGVGISVTTAVTPGGGGGHNGGISPVFSG